MQPLRAPPSLREIVSQLGGRLVPASPLDADARVLALAPLESATPADLSFLSNPRYRGQLAHTRALAVIVSPQSHDEAAALRPSTATLPGLSYIVTAQPYLYFARLTQWWRQRELAQDRDLRPRVHPSAVIDDTAQVDPSAHIGALCVIGPGVRIGAGSVLHARVTVAHGCVIGQRCIVHSGAVVGADGFGFAPRADGSWEKIEQLGAVRIGDDVEIGANSCIDRGALGDTVIGDGVKIDNLVQIGHNVQIGRDTALAGCAGVAGSAVIGQRCTIGGGAVVLGHLSLADGVHISASSTVTRSISVPGLHTGFFPIDDNPTWEKNAVTLKQLAKLRDRIKALENQTR